MGGFVYFGGARRRRRGRRTVYADTDTRLGGDRSVKVSAVTHAPPPVAFE